MIHKKNPPVFRKVLKYLKLTHLPQFLYGTTTKKTTKDTAL
jgi:hypothetical protein